MEKGLLGDVVRRHGSRRIVEDACHQVVLHRFGPLERYSRDVRITSIYEGASETQRLVIARTLLQEETIVLLQE